MTPMWIVMARTKNGDVGKFGPFSTLLDAEQCVKVLAQRNDIIEAEICVPDKVAKAA